MATTAHKTMSVTAEVFARFKAIQEGRGRVPNLGKGWPINSLLMQLLDSWESSHCQHCGLRLPRLECYNRCTSCIGNNTDRLIATAGISGGGFKVA